MTVSAMISSRWQTYLDEARDDAQWMNWLKNDLYPLRQQVRSELLEFLEQYLRGGLSTQDFQGTFDRKTRSEWVGFGLKGTSGAMFLNMLVKYLPDESELTLALRQALRMPEDADMAAQKLRDFTDFLENAIASGQVTRRQMQPARSVFFLSAWWHLQDVEQWPVFYFSARKVLEREGFYTSQSDWVEDYFAYRSVFQEIETELNIPSWEFEQLCSRQDNAKTETATAPEAATEEESQETVVIAANSETVSTETQIETNLDSNHGSAHTHVQWMLAKIGRKLGCQVWIARNDRSRSWKGEALGTFSVDSLPALGLGGSSQKIIELIDVVWLRTGKQIAAAFEVEHTTSIYSGLLRMSDLGALSPNLNFPFYIVTPEDRMQKVKKELSRPTFQILELHKRCGFFSSESLEAKMQHILEWASDPSAIDKLAVKVGDMDDIN